MGKTKEHSEQTRGIIIGLHKSGKSNREISRLQKIPRQTVDYIVKKFASEGTICNSIRPGRPRATTSSEDLNIVVKSKRNRRLTAPEIAAQFNLGRDKPVSVSTIKRRLLDAGLKGCVAVSKPLLKPINKKKRLLWAREHKNWTAADWEKVLWTDESKFDIFGSKRRVFVRRQSNERVIDACTVASVKHGGGSVMVWGCFGGSAVGDLVRIQGILKKEGYKSILENSAVPSGIRLIGPGFVFQQDNDPKHTSKLCAEFLKGKEQQNVLKLMTWPPQSPDLNPIELLWDQLDRQVRECCPTSQEDLWRKLQEEWQKITKTTLEKLIARMPKLCEAVIKNKGGHIDESKI